MESAVFKMALKPYLEAVMSHCENLSREELIETILGLALDVSLGERKGFLDKMESLMPESVSREIKKENKSIEKKLFDRIEALKKAILERFESIEDGTYWKDHGSPDDYEEEPNYVTEEHTIELEDVFSKVKGFFLNDQLGTARRLYSALFDLFDEIEELEHHFSGENVNIRKEWARYCRSVYNTSDAEHRTDELFEAMTVYAQMDPYRLKLSEEKYPMMQDVADAKAGVLEDWESFLPLWERKLADYNTDRSAVLQMEAIQWLEGTEGLARMARKWKASQPRGYLFWIQYLADEGEWEDMIDACQEALDIFPENSFREQVSEYFVKAGAELGNEKYVLQGKRERFLSSPGERNLLDLLEEAASQNARSKELNVVLAYMEDQKSSEEELYIRMLLMDGRLKEAFRQGQEDESLEWSYGKTGIIFCSTLSVLSKNSEKGVTIRSLLKEYVGRTYYSWNKEEETERAHREILTGLAKARPLVAQKKQYLVWAEEIGCDRIEEIVSNKDRKGYYRAAQVIGALAECYALLRRKKKAVSLLRDFYDVRYKRYSAFRREVKAVINDSELLKSLKAV